ncbi:MAG: TIGR03915 family putative DNA repair protein [Lachnospiraceae bacterium]|nr:TIGR03915 family putative DNA repair protein [Candidatus Colinaster scatohippi]
MNVFTCEDNLESKLTCIYTAWEKAIKVGHSNVRLEVEPIYMSNLFDEYTHVEADNIKAQKVSNSINSKISPDVYISVYYALLSNEDDALDSAYRFLINAFKVGNNAIFAINTPENMRMMELRRRVGNEIHSFVEFLRFHSINNQVYIGHIEPKADVIELVGRHFDDRMPSENWMIIDDNRRYAVVHPKDGDNYIKQLSSEEFERLRQTEGIDDVYTEMWRAFFDAIAIKERANRRCQMNHIPLWMRKHAVEFQG